MTDPLLDLVREYRHQIEVFNASPPDMSFEEDHELVAVTWGPHYKRLCTAPPDATTLEGAVEAARLVHDEQKLCGSQPDLTINVLRAALAFFDEGRVQA